MRILLLTMYYPPLNLVPCNRMASIADHFSSKGCQVDIITRYYDDSQLNSGDLEIASKESVGAPENYIVHDNIIYTGYKCSNVKLRKSLKKLPLLRGLYNYREVDVFHYDFYEKALTAFSRECGKKEYDFIISSYGPPVMLKTGYAISNKYKIPLVLDFRDSYITEMDSFMHRRLKRGVLNKVLSGTTAVLFASKGMQDYMNYHVPFLKKIRQEVIINSMKEPEANGYDEKDAEVVSRFQTLSKAHHPLLLHTGSVYSGQDTRFFNDLISGMQSLSNSPAICYLGLQGPGDPGKGIFYLPRVSRKTVLYLQNKADVLVIPVWKGRYSGFSGKVIENLHANSFTLCSPHPQKDLAEFLGQSPNAKIAADRPDAEGFIRNIRNNKIQKIQFDKTFISNGYWMNKLEQFLDKIRT